MVAIQDMTAIRHNLILVDEGSPLSEMATLGRLIKLAMSLRPSWTTHVLATVQAA